MKSLELLRLTILIILAVDLSSASLLAFGRTRPIKIHDKKVTEAPRVCLDSTIDLPSCNFAPKDEDRFELYSRREKRALDYLSSSDLPQNQQELDIRENSRKKYTRALTIVYKIEGCIPSRLPFDLPVCQSTDINDRILEVRRLFPFKVIADSKEDPGVPFVFPEIDYNKWRTFVKGPWTRPIEDAEDVEESSFEVSNESMRDESNTRKMGKRKKFEDSNDYKNKDGKATLVDDFLSRSFVAKNQLSRDRSIETNAHKMRTKETNRLVHGEKRFEENDDEKEHEDNPEEFPYERSIPYDAEKLFSSRLKSEYPRERSYDSGKLLIARLGSEFPYARAIPFDPAKLRAAERGSEFPYGQAISFDPKKFEDLRNIEKKKIIPFYTRRLKVVEETREDDFRETPFDRSMLAAAKEGRAFPYGKDVPDDTSKTLETMKLPNSQNSKEPEKIRVPVRHVLELSRTSIDSSNFQRKLLTANEHSGIRNVRIPSDIDSVPKDEKPDDYSGSKGRSETSSLTPRIVRGTIESSTSDLSAINDYHEIPSEWSEFPYAKAIPYDPTKLRLPRSEYSLVTIPRVFPYARAIPYDPWKLTAFVGNNRFVDQIFNPNDRDSLSRD